MGSCFSFYVHGLCSHFSEGTKQEILEFFRTLDQNPSLWFMFFSFFLLFHSCSCFTGDFGILASGYLTWKWHVHISLLPSTSECPVRTSCTHTRHSWCSRLVWPSWSWAGCLDRVRKSPPSPRSSSPSGSSAAAPSPPGKLSTEQWSDEVMKRVDHCILTGLAP